MAWHGPAKLPKPCLPPRPSTWHFPKRVPPPSLPPSLPPSHTLQPPGAREYSRRHFLSEQTLDMLADMRWQYACMLADMGVVAGPGRGGGSGGGSGGGGRGRTWMDDGAAAFNRNAGRPGENGAWGGQQAGVQAEGLRL